MIMYSDITSSVTLFACHRSCLQDVLLLPILLLIRTPKLLNMLTLKKVKVDIREKTPPPDTANMIPKNVVPIEEQVHHVYEKRPDICTVEIIVNNLKDMLALGTSILRPEASKHRVCNSSRKQKLQVRTTIFLSEDFNDFCRWWKSCGSTT